MEECGGGVPAAAPVGPNRRERTVSSEGGGGGGTTKSILKSGGGGGSPSECLGPSIIPPFSASYSRLLSSSSSASAGRPSANCCRLLARRFRQHSMDAALACGHGHQQQGNRAVKFFLDDSEEGSEESSRTRGWSPSDATGGGPKGHPADRFLPSTNSPSSSSSPFRRTSLPVQSNSTNHRQNLLLQGQVNSARGLLMDLLAAGGELSPNVTACLRAVTALLNTGTSPGGQQPQQSGGGGGTQSALSLSEFGLPRVLESPYSGEIHVSMTSKPRVSNITFSTVTSATGLPTIAAEPSRPRSSSYWKPSATHSHVGGVGTGQSSSSSSSANASSYHHQNNNNNHHNNNHSGNKSKQRTSHGDHQQNERHQDEDETEGEGEKVLPPPTTGKEAEQYQHKGGQQVLNSSSRETAAPSEVTGAKVVAAGEAGGGRATEKLHGARTAATARPNAGAQATMTGQPKSGSKSSSTAIAAPPISKPHQPDNKIEPPPSLPSSKKGGKSAALVEEECCCSDQSSSASNGPEDSLTYHTVDNTIFDRTELERDPTLKQIQEWSFPIFHFAERHRRSVLTRLTYAIFKEADLFRTFKISYAKFFNYFHALESGYWDIPYHNRIHAADVLHGCYYLTCHPVHPFCCYHSELDDDEEEDEENDDAQHHHQRHIANNHCDEAIENNEDEGGQSGKEGNHHQGTFDMGGGGTMAAALGQSMSALELMALFTAAAMHDYDHPGRTNAFLVASEDRKAILYNDRSVLENHHAAESWRLLTAQSQNHFIENLDSAEMKRFRYLVLEYILATDLKQHFDIIMQFNERAPDMDLTNESDRVLLSLVLIKFADINSPAKPYALHRQWTERICQEFYEQGDEEKVRHMAISPYMDRNEPAVAKLQDSFIAHIVNPLAVALNEAGLLPILPGLPESELIINLKHNHQKWLQQIETEPHGDEGRREQGRRSGSTEASEQKEVAENNNNVEKNTNNNNDDDTTRCKSLSNHCSTMMANCGASRKGSGKCRPARCGSTTTTNAAQPQTTAATTTAMAAGNFRRGSTPRKTTTMAPENLASTTTTSISTQPGTGGRITTMTVLSTRSTHPSSSSPPSAAISATKSG